MAKNVMRKVSNSVSKVVADTKMSPINLAILLVSLAIVVVLVILLVKRRKREGFALLDLLDSNWVAKGEDGVKGEDGPSGPQGPQGLQGPPGEDTSYSDEEKEQLTKDFKIKIMEKMINDKLIVKEDNEGEEKYFPLGTINMKTHLDETKQSFTYNDVMVNKKQFFNIKYNKLSKNSFVKITYVIPFTGWRFHRGIMLRMFVKESDRDRTISASSMDAGAWESVNWEQVVIKDIKVIGIDATDEIGEREYFVEIYFPQNYRNFVKDNHLTINGIHKYEHGSWPADHTPTGLLDSRNICKASCTIEEVVIADKSKISGDSDKNENMDFLKNLSEYDLD